MNAVSSILAIDTPRVFAPLLAPSRYKGAHGGRGSGKSHFFAECIVEAMVANPDCAVVCIREIQKSLKLSAKKLIEDKIAAFRLGPMFEIQRDVILRRGGKGLCIFQGMQDHTADSIKSLEGFDIAWVEEAQTLSQRSMNLLRPTIRKEGSEIWFSWNPRRKTDPVEKLLRSRNHADAIVVKANYTDNPFLPDVLKFEAEDDRNNDPDGFAHTWLGDYENMGSKVVIPRMWLEAAIDIDKKLGIEITGQTFSALDVAGAEDDGDENAIALRKGIKLFWLDKWNGFDTSLTTQRAVATNVQYGARHGFYDSAGVGEGVTGEWANMGRSGTRPAGFSLHPWNGGSSVLNPDDRADPLNPSSPKNKDQYHNLKAQAWFSLRKRCQTAYRAEKGETVNADEMICIPSDLPNLEQLLDEMTQPHKATSATGKAMVDKQPDETASPNLADAVVMAFFPIGSSYSWENF